jgi:hypothetical protein
MIIDSLENTAAYICIHPLFEKAFAYIKSINPEDQNTLPLAVRKCGDFKDKG